MRSPSEILVISSQILEKALPKIPALSNEDTATHVNFFLEETTLGKQSAMAMQFQRDQALGIFLNSFFSSYFSKLWWAEQGSNLRPIACRAIALPAELSAQIHKYTIKTLYQQ